MTAGFGIDFGTTNSISAICERGTGLVRPLRGEDGRPHPSVIWYRPGASPVVGSDAKSNLHGYSDQPGHHFVTSIKRELGKNRPIPVFGDKRESHEIASDIFRFLLARAREDRGVQERGFDLKDGVVTVPVYFDGPARRDLRRAADNAGFYITNFVHEPFAALVGYLHSNGDMPSRLKEAEGNNFLVFDWGGGTLDITMAGVRSGRLVEMSNAGLIDRAGDAFDRALMKWTRSRFLDQHRIALADLEPKSGLMDRYLAECERAKVSLSAGTSETIQLAQAYSLNGKMLNLDETVNREDLELLIERDLRDALGELDKARERSGFTDGEVELVLLIGGTSRIPRVRQQLEDRFGARVQVLPNADSVIAEGAAVVHALGMQPVLAQAIGVRLSDGTNYEVFPHGTVANPQTCDRTVDFFCTDNRRGEALLAITEKRNGDADYKTKTLLKIPVASDLPTPYNHERVTVRFRVDHDMVLNVTGQGATSDTNATAEIFDLAFGLSGEVLDE